MSQPPLRFLPEASSEAREAVVWYDAQQPGLGGEFVDEIMARATRAEAMPGTGRLESTAPQHLQLRWYDLQRFPYSILVGSVGDDRMVVAVAHQRRKPGYWRKRLVKLTF